MTTIKGVDSLLAEHPFFAGLDPAYLELIAGCASNVRFEAGQQVFEEGEPAEGFFLLRFGRVSVELFAPGKGSIALQTLEEGDVLGWSWLLPPYRWHHDARAVELTRALAFEGDCLRRKCGEDPRLGYELMSRFAQVIVKRLQSAQLQLMDVYGRPSGH